MIVRSYHDLKSTDKAVSDAKWTSVRMLLAGDGMGFSFHITTLEAGSEHIFEYKNHFESVYCISGSGYITDLTDDKTYEISQGVMYALDKHDRHKLVADEELVMACCFNPPVVGDEVHQKDGSYAAS